MNALTDLKQGGFLDRNTVVDDARTVVDKMAELAAHWRNEARHVEIADYVGDEITAEYGRVVLATAKVIERAEEMLLALLQIEQALGGASVGTLEHEAAEVALAAIARATGAA